MLLCKDCRGGAECVLCYRDTLTALVSAERRRRWRQIGQRAGVAACLTATALAGAGAALLPDPDIPVTTTIRPCFIVRASRSAFG
jgi:hypothetical protein